MLQAKAAILRLHAKKEAGPHLWQARERSACTHTRRDSCTLRRATRALGLRPARPTSVLRRGWDFDKVQLLQG